MKNVFYDLDPKTSLFEYHFPKESFASESNYVLSITEILEVIEDMQPKYVLIDTDNSDVSNSSKHSSWIRSLVLPQLAKIGIRKMAIVSKSVTNSSKDIRTITIFPGLTVAAFSSTEQAKQWLLNSSFS